MIIHNLVFLLVHVVKELVLLVSLILTVLLLIHVDILVLLPRIILQILVIHAQLLVVDVPVFLNFMVLYVQELLVVAFLEHVNILAIVVIPGMELIVLFHAHPMVVHVLLMETVVLAIVSQTMILEAFVAMLHNVHMTELVTILDKSLAVINVIPEHGKRKME